MKQSSRKAMIVSSLILTVVGFVVDRLWLNGEVTGPARAHASPQPGVAGPVVPADSASMRSGRAAGMRDAGSSSTPQGAEAAPLPATSSSLADRLRAFAAAQDLDTASVQDAFIPPGTWLAPPPPPEPAPAPLPTSAPEAAPVAAEPVRTFEDDHRVTSVFMTGQGGGAVVNGKLLRVGQEIDGYRLLRVSASGAVFASGEQEAAMPLCKGAVSP